MTSTDPHTPPDSGEEPSGEKGTGLDVDFEGRILLGRFRVGPKIGEGGMAFVYEATDAHDDDAKVVVKVPKAKEVAQPGFRAAFQREVDGLRHLKRGVHVVKILARGEAAGFPFLVLEHLGGGTLQTRLLSAGDRWLPLRTIEAWLRPMAQALDSIHAEGWIHRDVKPGNILFDERGSAYLSDFGVAKDTRARGHATSKGVVSGSFAYMAPEQAAGGTVTAASDQFALAATAYRALSGRCIYEPGADRSEVQQLLDRVNLRQVPPLRERAPQVSERAARAVMRALAYDPKDRFPSCTDFVDALCAETAPARAETSPVPPTSRSVAPPPRAAAPAAAVRTVRAPRATPEAEGRRAEPAPLRSSKGWVLGGFGVVGLAVGLFLMFRTGPSEPTIPRESLVPPARGGFPEESRPSVPDDRPTDAKPAGPSDSTPAEAEGGIRDLLEEAENLRRESAAALSRVPPWARVVPSQIAEAERLGVPVAFENGVGMRFVLVPAGSFVAGIADEANRKHFVRTGDRDPETNAKQSLWRAPPAHAARVERSFYLQATEVTNRQLRTWNPKHVSSNNDLAPAPKGRPTPPEQEAIQRAMNEDDHPATAVSYADARRFVAWLSERERRPCRLPTEVEWEYAARAGAKTDYFWGDDPKAGGAYTSLESSMTSSPVAALQPNAWGLWDLAGNADELCEIGDEARREFREAHPEEGHRDVWRWTLKGGYFFDLEGWLVPLGFRQDLFPDSESATYTGVGLRVAVDIPSR